MGTPVGPGVIPIRSSSSEPTDDSDDDIYQVETIVKHRFLEGRLQFLIKWVGYPASQSTWEYEENVFAKDLITDYWRRRNRQQGGGEGVRRAGRIVQTDRFAASLKPKATDGVKKEEEKAGLSSEPEVDMDTDLDDLDARERDARLALGLWDHLIQSVTAVEKVMHGEGKDGTALFTHVTWKDGRKSRFPTAVVNRKAPRSTIRFFDRPRPCEHRPERTASIIASCGRGRCQIT